VRWRGRRRNGLAPQAAASANRPSSARLCYSQTLVESSRSTLRTAATISSTTARPRATSYPPAGSSAWRSGAIGACCRGLVALSDLAQHLRQRRRFCAARGQLVAAAWRARLRSQSGKTSPRRPEKTTVPISRPSSTRRLTLPWLRCSSSSAARTPGCALNLLAPARCLGTDGERDVLFRAALTLHRAIVTTAQLPPRFGTSDRPARTPWRRRRSHTPARSAASATTRYRAPVCRQSRNPGARRLCASPCSCGTGRPVDGDERSSSGGGAHY